MMVEERVVTDDDLFSLLLSLDDIDLEGLTTVEELFDIKLCTAWSDEDRDSALPVVSPVPPAPATLPPSNRGASRLPGDPNQGQGLHDHGRPEQAGTAYSNVRLHDQDRSEHWSTAYPNVPVGPGPETPGPDSYLLLPMDKANDSMDAKPKEGEHDCVSHGDRTYSI
jgi:hypothetical protein